MTAVFEARTHLHLKQKSPEMRLSDGRAGGPWIRGLAMLMGGRYASRVRVVSTSRLTAREEEKGHL